MHQGKYSKKSRRRMGKSIALLVSLLLIIGVTLAGAIAFLMDADDKIDNLFTPSKITTEVEEDFDGTTKENVAIKNTGDTDAWIRAAVVVTWQDEKGNVYGQAPVAGEDYAITYNVDEKKADTTKWYPGNDGFYYWPKPVEAETGVTGVLIETCTYTANAPDGYYLTVEIIGSGIQSKPANVFNTEWASSGLTVKTTDDQDNELPPEQWTLVD